MQLAPDHLTSRSLSFKPSPVTFARRILVSSSLFHALNDAATVAVPMVFPILYTQRFIIHSYSQIGLLSNFGLLTTLLFQVLVVHLSRKVEYRYLLGTSFLGICLTLLLIPLSSSYFWLFFLYLIFRVFDSFYHTVGMAWVSRTHPRQAIDLAMGVQSGSGMFGVFLAFLTFGYLAQSSDWQWPLRVWAGACFLLGLLSFLLIRNHPFPKDTASRLDLSSWVDTARLVRRHIPGFLFGGASWAVTIYFAPSLLHHKFAISMGRTGLFMAVWIGIGTMTTYLFGPISRKFGRARAFKVGLAGASLSLLLVGLSPRPGPAVLGLFIFGTFLFLIFPALQSFVGNTCPETSQPQAFSLVSNLQMLAGALISLLSGFLSDRFGISSPFVVISVLGAAAFVLSAFFSGPAKPAPRDGPAGA
jgi:MFS family permease